MPKSGVTSEADHERHPATDPVLSVLGLGKHLWEREPGDLFFERLRSEDAPPPLPFEDRHNVLSRNTADSVWRRIESHER